MSELTVKIQSQQDLADKIRELQVQEKKLRAEILEECFGKDKIGTVKTQVDNVIVTGTYGLTYKFDQDSLEEAIENDWLSEGAMEAIRTKLELDKRVYDSLDDDTANELDDYLIVKPSLPSIKIKYVEEGEE